MNRRAPVSSAPTVLQQLMMDEESIRLRKKTIQLFGATWIRPPGLTRTLQQELDERAEHDEHMQMEETVEEGMTTNADVDGMQAPAHNAAPIVAPPEEELGDDDTNEADEDDALDLEEEDLDADIPEGSETWSNDDDDDDEEEEEDEDEEEDAEEEGDEVDEEDEEGISGVEGFENDEGGENEVDLDAEIQTDVSAFLEDDDDDEEEEEEDENDDRELTRASGLSSPNASFNSDFAARGSPRDNPRHPRNPRNPRNPRTPGSYGRPAQQLQRHFQLRAARHSQQLDSSPFSFADVTTQSSEADLDLEDDEMELDQGH